MVLDFATFLADAKAALNKASQVGGIGAYAQAQINDATVNVATEFNSMMSAIDNDCRHHRQLPQGRVGAPPVPHVHGGQQRAQHVLERFTAAQMAPVKTALDALVATISA
jgi:hypothetical protein